MSRQLRPCGTQAAYERHLRAGEKPCAPCRAAHNAYCRGYTRYRDTPPRKPQPCGTPAAYRRHRRRGEMPCMACAEALRVDSLARYYRKRNATCETC